MRVGHGNDGSVRLVIRMMSLVSTSPDHSHDRCIFGRQPPGLFETYPVRGTYMTHFGQQCAQNPIMHDDCNITAASKL